MATVAPKKAGELMDEGFKGAASQRNAAMTGARLHLKALKKAFPATSFKFVQLSEEEVIVQATNFSWGGIPGVSAEIKLADSVSEAMGELHTDVGSQFDALVQELQEIAENRIILMLLTQ